MRVVRHSADSRLGKLERELWRLRERFEHAETPLRKRIAQAAIEQARREYRSIPQGGAFEKTEAK